MNMLVQPTAGDQVINPLVGRGEVEIGITNIMEAQDALDGAQKDMRIVTAVHALRTPLFVRKDSGMFKNADLKGKRVTMGYSAMRNIDKTVRAMLAADGLTDADVRPVLVPNVVRSADGGVGFLHLRAAEREGEHVGVSGDELVGAAHHVGNEHRPDVGLGQACAREHGAHGLVDVAHGGVAHRHALALEIGILEHAGVLAHE